MRPSLTVAPVGKGVMHVRPGLASRVARLGYFLRHFVEMILAMMVGMAIFGGVRALLDSSGFAALLREHLDVRLLAMAAFMALPMALLMRYRGHGWERTAEMVAAMVVPVAVACLLWRLGLGAVVPALSDEALGTVSHVAMYVGMLLVMLHRFGEYGHAGPHVRYEHATHADHVADAEV